MSVKDFINNIIFFKAYDLVESAIEYNYEGIKSGIKVLDIGAGAGGFSLISEKYGAEVVAVEPIQISSLYLNRFINRCKFKILNLAHGDGNPRLIKWSNREKLVPTYSLMKIYEKSTIPDFIKIDTEGSEWYIEVKELEKIPRFEIEFHYPPICDYINPSLIDNLSISHTLLITKRDETTHIVHGFIK